MRAARQTLRDLDRNQPLYDVTTAEQYKDAQTSGVRMAAVLMTVFAGIALTLAVTGIYGIVSYTVAQRTHEIGVRLALGASPGEVVALVARRSLLLTGTGIVVGSAMATAGMRLLRSFLLTGPGRPLVLVGVAALMLAIALVAGAVPAWRAARIDPAVALREE